MDNLKFSSLLYRIIGKPESWQDEYIDIMHQLVDETESLSLDDPDNFYEIAAGEEFLNRISQSNETLTAFSALFDRSRFKLIMLDRHFKPIYHNQNAQPLYAKLLCSRETSSLKPEVLKALNEALEVHATEKHHKKNKSGLVAVDYCLERDSGEAEQIYLRPISDQSSAHSARFHVLLMLDQSRQQSELNSGLVKRYELTDKEQMVLINLIHGKNIKDIASNAFVSDNTIKTHLKSLFRKTDTKSQTDLVGLVLTHESQILDSYFDTNTGGALTEAERAKNISVVLSDGAEIVYREYGPRDGHPIIVCHNGYGCRTSIPTNYEQICQTTKRRIIIPDRPGFGKTPFIEDHPQRWPEQLNEFIDKLGIGHYDVLGNVLGCPLAIEFAVQADDRLKRLILASPVFVNTDDDSRHLLGVLAPSTRLVKASPRFARDTYELWMKSVSLDLGSHYRNMVEASLGDVEKTLFADDGTVDLMVAAFREGCSNHLRGISNEMVHCMTPRGIDLGRINAPVELWWGSQDKRISREGVQQLAAQFKDSTVHLKDGYSEHIYYALFNEIIA